MKYFDYVQYSEPVIDPSQQHSVLYQNYFIIIYMKKNSFTKSLLLLDVSKKISVPKFTWYIFLSI